jgi:anionic cell wall polymer biosynthesis LytR-Cps2A-Psr (LCP) family protein
VLVDFKAFSSIIDTLGGIDITLSKDEVEWMSDNGGGDNLKVGKNHLTGSQALIYARIRYVETKDGEANDFGRTNRQREILEIIYDEYKNSSISDLIDITSTVCPYITTDLTQSQIIDYVVASVSMGNDDLETLRLPLDDSYRNISVRGMSVLDLDWEENRSALSKFIYGHDFVEEESSDSEY